MKPLYNRQIEMNKEKYFIDLSKLSKEQIKALPQKFEKAGHKILSETLSDLITGKITDGFKFLFYSPSGWNQNNYYYRKANMKILSCELLSKS